MTTTLHRSLFRYAFVFFVALLFITQSASAQIWNPPTGAPPNNNAPAPIHEGMLGQGKGWGDLSGSSYTLGAILMLTQGLFSEWAIADNQGVAATQFCLGTEGEIGASNFPFGTEGLDCITEADGWPGSGQDGQDGVGGGVEWPAATAGQTLFYNEALGVWQASEFLRSIDGGVGDNAGKIMLGRVIPGANNDIVTDVSINGSLRFSIPEQPSTFYQGKILGYPGSGLGTVAWMNPEDVGLGGGGSLPAGNTGDIMYFNGTDWVADNSFFIHNTGNGDRTAIVNKIGFSNNANIPGNDYLNCVGDQILRLQAGNNNFGADLIECTSKITIDETMDLVTVNGATLAVNSENAIFTKLEHTQDVRPVCAEEDGDLTLCGNAGSGFWQQTEPGEYTFTVPEGVYEINVSVVGAGGGGGAGGLGRAWHMMGSTYMDILMAGGGGGGAGGRGQTPTLQLVEVTPGEEITVNVGAGGLGGCAYRNEGGTPINAGCNPNGTGFGLQNSTYHTGKPGADGENTTVTLQDGTVITALGGEGGEGGTSAPTSGVGLANVPDYLYIAPGGDGGDNYMISPNAMAPNNEQHGQNGQVYNDTVHNMINNTNGCWQQNKVAAGGHGGDPLGGFGGNGGAGVSYHGTWEPQCDNNPNNYLMPQASPKGNNGLDGSSGQGGGGGGGGASIAGWPYLTGMGSGPHDLGHGGFGGDGGHGRVTISWN